LTAQRFVYAAHVLSGVLAGGRGNAWEQEKLEATLREMLAVGAARKAPQRGH